MKTVLGSGCTLSGGDGAGGGAGLSVMPSGYRERPEHRLKSECEHRALKRQLERIDRALVRPVAIAGAVGHAQLCVGGIVEELVELGIGATGIERETQLA